MALDHYVSQVHLRNFYSPDLKERMYAIRKADQHLFTPNARSVCRIEENSTTPYLKEDRAIEGFLKVIEPKYNSVVQKLLQRKIDRECIEVIAGFLSYIWTCSPAGIRINSEMFRAPVHETALIMEKRGLFPPLPAAFGGENFTEMLETGKIQINIDGKYPQAVGITNILALISLFGNSKWEILINLFADNLFFTSDFPVALERTKDPRVFNKIVPLTPSVAVRIMPDINRSRDENDFTFKKFQGRFKELSLRDVVRVNKLIVQCAEDLVFFNKCHDWVPRFVAKNSCFWIEPQTTKIPTRKGTLLVFTHRVCRKNPWQNTPN